jgi:hypothetical protein
MIIHQPEILHKDGYAILWSRIETDAKPPHFPDHIWYRVPERYLPFLHIQSDAFLVAGLLAGMYYGEDIQVRGTVSPRLAYHLDEYQFLLNFRSPKVVRPVSIQYERLAPLTVNPTGVGTTFSGGVDSLFTIWKHLPQNQPDPNYQISHGIFICGFDILPGENEYYQRMFRQYSKQASRIGIDLIELETNVMGALHQRMILSYFFGPVIVSAGLVFSGLFQRFYVPSSWDYYNLKKASHSSDPLIDGFLSTETLDIIHHGSTHRRVEKVEQIADWDVAQDVLWVCTDHKFKETSWNCSRCEKCFRTMIPLYSIGKLDKFKTFEKPIKTNRDGLWWARRFSLRSNYISEMFPFVKKHKADFLPWLYLAALLGYIRYFIINNLPGFVKNWLRRYGYFVLRNEAPDAYEVPAVTQFIRDMHDRPSA